MNLVKPVGSDVPIEVEAIFEFEALGSAKCPCGNEIPTNATLADARTEATPANEDGSYEEKLTQTFRCNGCGRLHHRSIKIRYVPEGTPAPCPANP